MFGLVLVTGLPGASKTLNTLKMIIEDDNHDNRLVYYNNIKLLFLDYSVCDSFAGYFYGVYKPSLKGSEASNIQKLMERVHTEQRLVQLSDVPHLEQMFDAWKFDGGLKLWLHWIRRVYPKARLRSLEDYLKVNPIASFEQLRQFNLHWERFDDPTLWYRLPRPCRIVVDECQRWFPPRPVGSKVPQHISEFETFRHSGADIFLITQNAKLLDSNVRRLAVNHLHFVRNLGASITIRYQASKCTDFEDYFGRKSAQKKTFKRDVKFYGLYHSADRHTYRFKMPTRIYLLAAGVCLLVYLLFSLISSFSGSSEASSVSQSSASLPPSNARNQHVNSSSLSILPSSALSNYEHPLKGMCVSLSLAGFETIRSGGLSVRKFYLNCQTNEVVPVFASNDSENDSNEENSSSGSSIEYKRRLLLDFQTLRDFGYHLEFTERGNPILIFAGQRFLLMEV